MRAVQATVERKRRRGELKKSAAKGETKREHGILEEEVVKPAAIRVAEAIC